MNIVHRFRVSSHQCFTKLSQSVSLCIKTTFFQGIYISCCFLHYLVLMSNDVCFLVATNIINVIQLSAPQKKSFGNDNSRRKRKKILTKTLVTNDIGKTLQHHYDDESLSIICWRWCEKLFGHTFGRKSPIITWFIVLLLPPLTTMQQPLLWGEY